MIFTADEKQTLLLLTTHDFEVKYCKSLKVAHSNHIYLGTDKHHYSMPFDYTGRQPRVIYARSIVRTFGDRGMHIATHSRSLKNQDILPKRNAYILLINTLMRCLSGISILNNSIELVKGA